MGEKIHIPFPEDGEKAQISWLLNHMSVRVQKASMTAYCTTSPENASKLKNLFESCADLIGITFGTHKQYRQILFTPGAGFIPFLEGKACEHELNVESKFHQSLNEKRAIAGQYVRKEMKIHTPFPTEERDIISWLLDNCRARVENKYYIRPYCNTNSPNSERMQTWLATFARIDSWNREHFKQISICLERAFSSWLESKAEDYELNVNSKFHKSLQTAKEQAEINHKEMEQVKQKIITKIEEKYGRKGCRVCGTYNNLEFDHENPSTKSDTVSNLLYAGKFAEAEYEGVNFCQTLCTQHHRDKTSTNKDFSLRKPPSGDSAMDERREKTRIRDQQRLDRARERLLKAKLKIGKCSQCPLICTEENASNFDFHHRDPKTKNCTISELVDRSDNVFYAELPGCDMTCVSCHKKETQRQHDAGILRDKRRENRKRKREESHDHMTMTD